MLKTGVHNLDLVKYLVGQLAASSATKFKDLLDFFPQAQPGDWEKLIAGQRVQVIRPDGTLQFGTEVITAKDGSIAGLLGASPGASTATPIMLEVLEKCFPDRWADWEPTLSKMVPSYGTRLSDQPDEARKVMARTAQALGLN